VIDIPGTMSDRKFQFLLVRLREAMLPQVILMFLISIPSGAIKRVYSENRMSLLGKFQFLLVRLRVPTNVPGVSLPFYISIPSGAIKR